MSSTKRLHAACVAVALVAGCMGSMGSHGTATASSDDPTAADPRTAVAYQDNPAHDGSSQDTSFVAPFTERWSRTLDGTVGYPLIANGRVFVTVAHASGYGNDVEALSLSTGKVLWGPISIGGTYWTGSIAYDNGRVFALNYNGRLTALDAETGAVSWTTQLAGQYAFTSPPTAVGGTVYVGGAGVGGTLYAVDQSTGSTTWTASVANGDHSSPAVDASGVHVSYACEQAYKFDLTGSQVWHHTTNCGGGGGRTPVLHGGKVYIRDSGKPPAILDGATGTQTASFAAGPAPAFDGDRMAAVSQGVLTVSDASTGDPIWRAPGSDAVTAPLIANGHVIEGMSNGTIEARLVHTGELAWSGRAGADFDAPDEHNALPLTGLAQADGALVAPAGTTLTVFESAGETTVDLTAGPEPGGFAGSAVTFGLTSGVRNPQYVCTLDGVTEPCTSPVRISGLAHGTHRFSVSIAHATTGATARTFSVDALAPTARVVPFSPSRTSRRTVTARWSASDRGSGVRSYQVRTRQARTGKSLPSWSVRPTTSTTRTSLSLRRHSRLCVSVRAKDQVGNWSGWSSAGCVRRR